VREEHLGVVKRCRGDAKINLDGLDLADQGRRVRLSILKPVAVEDETEGHANWREHGRIALRLAELDDLIAKLQEARAYLA
jgi:hypothetical protein